VDLPFDPSPAAVQPKILAGRYRFTHDGWLGTLVLEPSDSKEITGSYHDDRFGGEHDVVVRLGTESPHSLEIVIRDFNWMPEQRFEGWLFTQGQRGFAGRTTWQGVPYGFFGRKSATLNLDSFRSGPVRLSDLQGLFRVVQDGVQATLQLDRLEPDCVSGHFCFDPANPPLPARATLGGVAPHAVRIAVFSGELDSTSVFVIEGLLFTREKNAVAGSVEWQGGRYGCHMVRIR
jgi:hypothetical protein